MMRQEHILSILYELAMIMSGETRSGLLVDQFLQRLMFHTGFPCGLYMDHITQIPEDSRDATLSTACLENAIGDPGLTARRGQQLMLPLVLMLGESSIIEDEALLVSSFGGSGSWRTALKLRISDSSVFILLSSEPLHGDLPLTTMFDPVLRNFAQVLELCRNNEAYTRELLCDRTQAQAGLVRFRAALDSSSDSIFIIDPKDMHFVDFNRSAEEALGYGREELLGMGLRDIVRDQDIPTLAVRMQQVVEEGVGEVVGMHRRKDGSELAIEVRLSLLQQEGHESMIIAVARDITERIHAEEALRDNEERFRQLAENIHEVFWITSLDKNEMIYISPAYEDIWGRSCASLYAKPKTWLDAIHPDDRERVIANAQQKQVSGDYNETFRILCPGGSLRWIRDRAFPVRNASGDVYRIAGIAEDITLNKSVEEALRESQQRLNYAQRMAHIGSWELDLIKNELTWSDEVYRIFGADTNKSDKPRTVFVNTVHPDDLDKVNLIFTRSVENKTLYKIEHRLIMPDGTIKHVQERCETFYDEEGKPLRSLGTVQDITEHTYMEEALRRSQKMEAIGQLSGGIAHDFNNQLGVIIGYLDILKEHFPEEKKPRHWVDTATKATLRCMDLTRQLLAFSRRQSKEKVIADLNVCMEDMESVIARSVTPEVEVQSFLADELWLTEIDPGEFQDAILNMVINARDAMPDGGKLLIETSNKYLNTDYMALNPETEAGDYVQLMLSDTGTGMDKATLNHVFEPFFTTKSEDKGTGLGMAMVYGFVKRNGGFINLYSELGVGTTIRTYLPRSTASESTVIDNNDRNTELPGGGESILIVDDEGDLLQLADQYLSDLGYRTHLAENATQALAILVGNEQIDLLFSDVVMPGGMNGYELAQQATQQQPDLKVLLTSGFTSKTIAHNGLARFSVHLLDKPYRNDDLAQRIRFVLNEETMT